MNRDIWLQYYHELPESVQDYLLDPVSGEHEEAARKEVGVELDIWDRLMDVAWELLFTKITKIEFESRLKRACGDLDFAKIERALLFHIVLPLADLVPWDVEQRLVELGIAPGGIQQTMRISLRPVSYRVAVRRVASLAKLSILSEDLVQRLRDLTVSYLRGVRTIEQLTEVLQRPSASEGTGFTKSQAQAFTEQLVAFRQTTQIMSEDEFAVWLQKDQQRALEDRAEQQRQTALAESARQTLSDVDRDIQSARAFSTAVRSNDRVEQIVDTLVTSLGNLGLDEYLERRFRNVISARLRDVRNDIQTKAILTREQKVGGLGFDEARANQLAVEIEKTYNEQHVSLKEEEQKKINQATEEQKKRAEERRKQEAEEHAKWYQEKIKAREASDPSALLRQVLAGGAAPASTATPPPLQPALRPTMDSVVAPPTPAAPQGMRLTGLAEELGRMTMQEFRRLAPDAAQASKAILQKLEALKADSFERWTEGVNAWRSSPLQQQYLRLIAESFTAGKPVGELADGHHAQDPDTPSSSEIAAIIEVNTHIQFS